MTNYIDDIAVRIAEACGDDPDEVIGEDVLLYRFYAVLALTKGTDTTKRDVHDAWCAWESGIWPEHRSILPWEHLTPETQMLDQPYVDAIHAVAWQMRQVAE